MKRFMLVRNEDVSGISGTGAIAEGIEFTTGKVCLNWRTAMNVPSVTVFDSIADVEKIHGHGGATVVQWIDEVPA